MTATPMLPTEIARGLRLHHAGDLEGAGREYEAALARDPASADARCLLGVIRQQQGRAAEAIGLIEAALALRSEVPAYHASLGMAYLALGRPVEAERAFAPILGLCGSDASAHLAWGDTIRTMGARDASLAHYRRAAELEPRLARARFRLGELLLELDRAAEALPHGEAAAALEPAWGDAHILRGNAYLALGRPFEARDAYERALGLDPARAQAAAGRGLAATRLNLKDEALAWLRRAVELEPRSVEYLRYLGEAASAYGLRDLVRSCCDRILAIDPNYAAAHNTLGSIAHREGRLEDARAHYLDAARLEPRLAGAHYNLGMLHEELGEVDLAEERYRTAVRCGRTCALAQARLAALRRGALPEADLEAIHAMLADPLVLPDGRVTLLFALAEVHDGRGEFARAAEWLERANRLGRDQLVLRGNPYSPDDHRRFVDAIMAAFPPALLDRLKGAGLATRRPVFVVGMPRSGTTLLEQILASHPDVHGAGEIRLVRHSLEEVGAVIGRPDPPLECVAHLRAEHVALLARRHEERLLALDGGRAARIVNKLPENYFYLGLIALLFPDATVIHCRRDPRDVALSCWASSFVEVRWAHDYGHIATRLAEYHRLMVYWRTALPASFALIDVDYEDTVADLEGVARRMIAALGLEWHPACLEFHRTRRPVQTASQHQVRQPIYRSSVGRWKHYEHELSGLWEQIDSLGLPPRSPPAP